MRPGFSASEAEHTPMLAGDVRGNCIADITEISRRGAGQIAAGLAAPPWPADAAGCPGSPRPIRGDTCYGRGVSRRQAGRLYGLLAGFEGRIRDHVYTGGAWPDSLLYLLLADERAAG